MSHVPGAARSPEPLAPEGSPGRRPPISVVVIASRHPKYLGDALASLDHQSLPSDQFEVVVVRDYDDPPIPRSSGGVPRRDVRVEPGDLGPAIDAGVRTSSGEILVFLDDDDRFRPEKLGIVAREFASSPGLGFLRNGYAVIDEGGRVQPEHPFRSEQRRAGERLGPRTVGGPERIAALRALPPLGLDFNSSCISVRRTLLSDFLPHLELRGFRLLDELAFVAALASPLALRFDPTVLTEYRIHGENTTFDSRAQSTPLARRAAFSRASIPSYAALVRAARDANAPAAVEEAEGQWVAQRAFAAMREPATPRVEFARLRRELRRYRHGYLARSDPRLSPALRLFSISPAVGRWMYARAIRARSRGPSTAR